MPLKDLQARREYLRQYCIRNSLKNIQYQKEYRERNHDLLRAKAKESYYENREQKRAQGRKFYQKNIQVYREYANLRHMQLKITVYNHYCKNEIKCQCCGESEFYFLTVDHIEENGAEQRKQLFSKSHGGNSLYRWLIKNNFPEGYQILCMNCNFSKGKYGVCPHEVFGRLRRTG